MVISFELLTELTKLEKEIFNITKNHTVTDKQLESFLYKLELYRKNILNEVKIHNKKINNENNKIYYIDEKYKAFQEQDYLKILIPETMPKYKNITNATYKRILLNVSEKTTKFANMFQETVFVYIKVFDNQKNWDVDNKSIKPILDGLVLSNVIEDDNFKKVFICIQGFYSKNPHTEVIVSDAEYMLDVLERYN